MSDQFGDAACSVPGCTRKRVGTVPVCKSHREVARARTGRGDSRRRLTDEEIAEIRRMWAALKTKREIALKLGINIGTVAKHVSRS